jgi:hypothetical protein
VHTITYFEVIDIVNNTSPYPTLLGLDWDFDNQAIINLKRIGHNQLWLDIINMVHHNA